VNCERSRFERGCEDEGRTRLDEDSKRSRGENEGKAAEAAVAEVVRVAAGRVAPAAADYDAVETLEVLTTLLRETLLESIGLLRCRRSQGTERRMSQ
jgi:hypothetical protein